MTTNINIGSKQDPLEITTGFGVIEKLGDRSTHAGWPDGQCQRDPLRAAVSRGPVKVRADTLPDYVLDEVPGDIIAVRPRDAELSALGPEVLDAARALALGADVYALEAEWRAFWERSGRKVLRLQDKVLLGWIEARVAL